MLTQFQLKLQANVPCLSRQKWAYNLYAALLKASPKNLAKTIHEAPITPVSTYFLPEENGGIWIVNLLGKAVEEPLRELLNQKTNWIITCDSVNLTVQHKQVKNILSVDELLAIADQTNKLHRLKLCTPTAFKSAGQYQILLTTRLIVQSLIKKWNGCLLECPIVHTMREWKLWLHRSYANSFP